MPLERSMICYYVQRIRTYVLFDYCSTILSVWQNWSSGPVREGELTVQNLGRLSRQAGSRIGEHVTHLLVRPGDTFKPPAGLKFLADTRNSPVKPPWDG